MTFSFARLGFWKVLAVAASFELLYFLLRVHWPELSPHYHGYRAVWMRILLISEALLFMATFLAAAGTIENDVRTKNWKRSRTLWIILAVVGYLAVFIWVLR